MDGRMKNYKEYLSQDYIPIDSTKLPYYVNMRALRDYANSKGVSISALSENEKNQFLIKNKIA